MVKREKSAAGKRSNQFAVESEWHLGQRTAAWNELWRQILVDVLQQDGQLADQQSESAAPDSSPVAGEASDA